MSLFDLFKPKKRAATSEQDNAPQDNAFIEPYISAKKAELCDHDKEVLMVRRVSLQDMQQFTSVPFAWNSGIKMIIAPSTKPFAYMDIVGSNVFTACLELDKMNQLLHEAPRLCTFVPLDIKIPIDDIIWDPKDKRGASKIICTPYTFTGRIAKYPVSLSFKTNLAVIDSDSTHGELFFGQSGDVEKARICCWRYLNGHLKGYFFHFRTVNGQLIISKIETSAVTNDRGLPIVVYRAV